MEYERYRAMIVDLVNTQGCEKDTETAIESVVIEMGYNYISDVPPERQIELYHRLNIAISTTILERNARGVAIFQFHIPNGEIRVIECVRPIHFGIDKNGNLNIWAEVHSSCSINMAWKFRVYETGNLITEDWDHIISCHDSEGAHHLYAERHSLCD